MPSFSYNVSKSESNNASEEIALSVEIVDSDGHSHGSEDVRVVGDEIDFGLLNPSHWEGAANTINDFLISQ